MIAGVKYSDYQDLVQGTTVEELTEPYVWTLFPLILHYVASNSSR